MKQNKSSDIDDYEEQTTASPSPKNSHLSLDEDSSDQRIEIKRDQRQFEQKILAIRRQMQASMGSAMKKQMIKSICVIIGLILLLSLGGIQLLRTSREGEGNQQLKSRLVNAQTQIVYLQKKLNQLQARLTQVSLKTREAINDIMDLHMNQLLKQERSIHILKKYSSQFKFALPYNTSQHYRVDAQRKLLRKKTQQISVLKSYLPIPVKGIHFLQMKIQFSSYKMIALGVLTEQANTQNCAYCETSQMYYLYCYDGKIYHDSSFFTIFKDYKFSKSQGALQGDIITMFIDQQQWQVAWYINNRHIGSQKIDAEHRTRNTRLYPFIEITTKGDQIIFLNDLQESTSRRNYE